MSKDTARERIAAALDKVRLHGVGLVLVMFASGLIAAAFFTTEPERQLSLAANATEVWTDKREGDPAEEEFERVPARPVRQLLAKPSTRAAAIVTADVADTAAAFPSVQASDQPKTTGAETIEAHVEWCSC